MPSVSVDRRRFAGHAQAYRRPLCLAALAAVLSSAVLPAQQRPELVITPETYRSSAGDTVAAERGRLTVPERWDRPTGAKVELHFIRFKSTAARPGPPIVYLAGGPGGSGIESARGARFGLFMALRQVADVIAFDQRGTGSSKPSLACPEPWSYPTDRPGQPDEVLAGIKTYARACAAHLAERGIDVTAYHTNASADDIDALRRALGAERITLWGISYGTHLGFAVLRRHPGRIHRAVLAGSEGPDHTLKLPTVADAQIAMIDSLARLDPAVARVMPSFAGVVRSVLARLDSAPVRVVLEPPGSGQPSVVVVSKFDLQRMTAASLGSSPAIRRLPQLFFQLSRNDFTAAARNLAQERSRLRLTGMQIAMDCASGVTPERLARIRTEAQSALLGGWIDFPFPGICDGWPRYDLGPAFRAPLRSDVPTLFISGTLDGRTPPANAEEVRRGFANSEHLIIDGASHSDDLWVSSPVIGQVILEFLRGQRPSTTRIAVPVRFVAPGDSTRA